MPSRMMLRAAVRGTVLADAAIIRVSARTRSGLSDLLSALSAQLTRQPSVANLGRPRLALDRVFTMEGFGTVVTGTLTDGELATGDEIRILPLGSTRPRTRFAEIIADRFKLASPGSRTAVKHFGHLCRAVEARRGAHSPRGNMRSLDVSTRRFRLLPAASAGMVHNREVKVFLGTSDTLATLRLPRHRRTAAGHGRLDPAGTAAAGCLRTGGCLHPASTVAR